MANKPLVILGSARKDSDTRKLIDNLLRDKEYALVDLLDYNIGGYNYEGQYPESDDFLKLVEVMLQHEQLIFATPVYWYGMSGSMKMFFDRLTDIVTIHKTTGRQLKGKKTFLLAVGAEALLPDGFEVPFKLTSVYFNMNFRATYYATTKALDKPLTNADSFLQLLNHEQNV